METKPNHFRFPKSTFREKRSRHMHTKGSVSGPPYWRRHVRTCSNHTVHIAYKLCEGRRLAGTWLRSSFVIIIVILYPASPTLAFTILHNYALIVLCRWRRCTYILTKMLCGLFDKVARLMKADKVSLGVAHSLTNRSVVRLTGVAILRRTP